MGSARSGAGGGLIARLAAAVEQLLRSPFQARRQTGKPLRAQFLEIVQLWALGLRPLEYYRFRLFDDERVTPEQRREYTGWRFQRVVYRAVNDPGLMAETGLAGGWDGKVDKVLFDCLMQANGLRTARLLGIFDPAGVTYGNVATLRTREELRFFLRQQRRGALFVKPARASSGDGAFAIETIADEYVMLADQQRLALDEVVERIVRQSRVVIQQRLRPHPLLRAATNDAIGSVRVIVLRRSHLSTVHRTYVRLPVGANMVDNFAQGGTGNLSGSVDPASGRIERVYDGIGLDQVRVLRHPDTGAELEGFQLPDWEAGIELIVRASRVLSGLALQAWDLALTDRGPVLMEVNDVCSGDVQLAGPPGLLDQDLTAFLRERGFKWPYPYSSDAKASRGAVVRARSGV